MLLNRDLLEWIVTTHLEPNKTIAYNSDEELKEALRWKSRSDLDSLDIIYIYGIGHATYYPLLRSWLDEKKSRRLIFIEDKISGLRCFSIQKDINPLLTDSQVQLRWLVSEWDHLLEELASQFPFSGVEVIAIKSYRRRKQFSYIKMALLRKTVLWKALTAEHLSAHLLHRNILNNFRKIPDCFYVNRWKGAMEKIPLIICGAGPSLDQVAAELDRVRDSALILSCGSALSALSHFNIRPHLALLIDPNPSEWELIKVCRYSDIPILFSNRLFYKIFDLFQAPYGYIRSGTGGALEKEVEQQLGFNEPPIGPDLGREALSVTTLAFALACSWGCDPIISIGVDLSYGKGGRPYASGVPSFSGNHRKSLYRRNREGKWVATEVRWIMEQETIDNYVQTHSETKFFDMGQGGLGFRAIPYRSWRDISEDLIKKERSIDDLLTDLIHQSRLKRGNEEIKRCLSSLEKSLQRTLIHIQAIRQEAVGSGRSILYQLNLEEEDAYRLLLASAQQAFYRTYQLLSENVEEKSWDYLYQVTETYLSLISSSK